MKYLGEICLICSQAFEENSDVVVCPDCGTPHHRHCWQENNACVNEDKHKDGFAYYVQIEESVDVRNTTTKEDFNTENQQNTNFEEFKSNYGIEFGDENIASLDEIDGIKVRDFMQFIGFSSIYYLPVFYSFSKGKKKTSFNVMAGFFFPLHQLYRRMNVFGIFLTIIRLFTSVNLIFDVLRWYFNIDHPTILSKLNISEVYFDKYMLYVWFIDLAIFVLMALFNDRIYFNYVKKKIKYLRNQFSDDNEYYAMLSRTGKPKALNALFIYIGIFILSVVILSAFI